MKNLFIVWPENQREWQYYLINEDWYCMASHICSSIWWARDDLIEWRPERKEQWKEYLSDGYSLKIAIAIQKEKLFAENKKFSDVELMKKYSSEILKEINI